MFDAAMENFSQILFRGWQETHSAAVRQLSARDVYLLLTYGRSEEDDELFGTIFDQILLPKMRAGHGTTRLLEEAGGINLRAFLLTATIHHRLESVWKPPGERSGQVRFGRRPTLCPATKQLRFQE